MAGPRMHRLPRLERLVLLLLLAGAMLAAFLLPADLVLGTRLGDMPEQFIPWRAFAAASLKAGHLPLWNPYTYAGEPFLGGFQSALLYPPNAIFLILPLGRAINLSIFLHLLVLAWGLYRWAARRGLHPVAGMAGAALLALGGTVYPHVSAGHLSNLCAMAWAPWILGGLESWGSTRRWGGLLEASAAVCLQILAGHVQYVFITAVAGALQALAASLAEPAARRRALPAFVACYAAGALLAAAQLLPGLAAAAEGIRQGRLSYAVASSFFFPPENLLTLFAPGFFGDHLHTPYWGRWYIQEASAFMGSSGVVLLLIGLWNPPLRRRSRMDLAMAALLLLLALGASTPVYRLLYDFAPLYGRFRGVSKFIFPAMAYLALVAAAGTDALVRRHPPRGLALAPLGLSLALGGAGLFCLLRPEDAAGWMQAWLAGRHDPIPLPDLARVDFARQAAPQAARSLLEAAGLFLALAGGLAGRARWAGLRWAPLLLLAAELAAFARSNLATCRVADATPPGARNFVATHPGDYRVLTVAGAGGFNGGYLLGASDLWGDDPSLLGRYAEFMAFSQRSDPNQPGQYLKFIGIPEVYSMLRLRYILAPGPDGIFQGHPVSVPPMDRVQLISQFQVTPGRDAVFAAMTQPDFDPRRRVLLESDPEPRPVPTADPGTARVVDLSADSLTIEADARTPSLLLVTDLYSRDWRAVALPGSAQAAYEVLPADYVLRAVPLAAGHHRLRMEYVPRGLAPGLAVSLAAWAAWCACAAGLLMRRRRDSPAGAGLAAQAAKPSLPAGP